MDTFIPTVQIAQRIEQMVANEMGKRKAFERRWYNNNFFDDGYHYRFVSRTTGRVVDLSTTSDTFIPYRAIPKAARQVRGVANLLLANEPIPVVYPEKSNTPEDQQSSKLIAQRTGQWLESKWKDLDMKSKLTLMVILAAKHGVSYLQVYPDVKDAEIRTEVYDAFEIFLRGNMYSIYESPFIIKASPAQLSEIMSNKDFDEAQKDRLNPDNKYAASEIKEAYMMARYGTQRPDDKSVSVILKEGFIKEYINDENREKIAKDLGDEYRDKKEGDPIIRQVFECSGIWLKDTYLNLSEYPFVDFRFEPGPIYQVPLIERFIPANKSLDTVMSRIERHIGTMAVGAWLKRRGEQYTISNLAGGQVVEYDQTPPVQAQVASLPNEVFAFIQQLNQIIEEQGATTSALGNTPPGVKSGIAIESLKASEYANLKIATDQLKKTVKNISEKMLDIAANYYTNPQTVYRMEQGQPDYFDVIGQKGLEKYKAIAGKKGATITIPQAIPLKKDYKVEIEIESGLGYTMEGKKNTMIQIVDYMAKMAQGGYVTPEAVTIVLKKFLEVFQFGSTQEFMNALEQGTPPLTETQLQSIKVAVLSVIKDLQDSQQGQIAQPMPGEPLPNGQTQAPQSSQDEDILKTKTAVMEAFNDMKNAS